MIRLTLALLVGAMPVVAQAQAYRCAVPQQPPRPRPDGPSASQPKRVLPIGGYTLALTWAAQYCHDNEREAGAGFQCARGNQFGFTLHGLWPDGEGATWPQYCRATGIVPPAVIRRQLCATPSAQLIQHEWAKHGTCMSRTPEAYFTTATRLYGDLRYPDMAALSRRPALTAGEVARAVAAANPGITPDMMRITANRQGWLEEVWLCLDKQLRYATCPAHQGGLASEAPVKIWRGGRRR